MDRIEEKNTSVNDESNNEEHPIAPEIKDSEYDNIAKNLMLQWMR